MQTSPRALARTTAVFYLLTIAGGIVAQGFISQRLIAFNDAALTVQNITAHRPLFELGFTIYLLEMACNVVITGLFYTLLAPVSRNLSLLAALFGVAGCTIKTFARVFYIAPLAVLDQPQTVLLLLKINDHGAAVALAFFGFATLLKGWLIVRSTFLPRILGVLSMIAGIGWLMFVSPALGARAFPYLAPFGLLAAVVQIGWLLVVGVDEERWLLSAARSGDVGTRL
jgi:hypothetical protein